LKGDTYRFKTVVDGLFLTHDPGTIYKKANRLPFRFWRDGTPTRAALGS